jgi:hypothetical protein
VLVEWIVPVGRLHQQSLYPTSISREVQNLPQVLTGCSRKRRAVGQPENSLILPTERHQIFHLCLGTLLNKRLSANNLNERCEVVIKIISIQKLRVLRKSDRVKSPIFKCRSFSGLRSASSDELQSGKHNGVKLLLF